MGKKRKASDDSSVEKSKKNKQTTSITTPITKKTNKDNKNNTNNKNKNTPNNNNNNNNAPRNILSRKFCNKQRVLVFGSRGLTARGRHLMEDLRKLLPHSKKEVKMDHKDQLSIVNEICEMKSCNNCVFFECRKHQDLYLWVSKAPNGPSARFLVQNIHTMDELQMTGNCLLGSRPLLSFDSTFDTEPHYRLLKELFIQVFGTPRGHPKSKPFIDHIFSFSIVDKRIWFRNFQIVDDLEGKNSETTLAEIGPRFVLNPIRIFSGGFGGETLFKNGSYISPNKIRSVLRKGKQEHYQKRLEEKKDTLVRKALLKKHPVNPVDYSEVFDQPQ